MGPGYGQGGRLEVRVGLDEIRPVMMQDGGSSQQDEIDRAACCAHCSLRFYPRLSPCMIVLVTRGDELLLAHHQRATRVVYSTLAGFVEAGESVEDCVRREVMEEVGVTVGELHYFQSQPWPILSPEWL